MLKGPIALALIGPTAIVWLLIRPKPTDGNRLALPISQMLLGTATVLALAAPWFFWVNHATGGEFLQVFFWHHNVERFAGTSPTLASHPWWYYLPRFAVDFLPWTPILAMLGWQSFFSPARRVSKGETQPLITRRAGDAHSRFGLVWFATMFVVHGFSSALARAGNSPIMTSTALLTFVIELLKRHSVRVHSG